jgi:hypothetical protein
VGVYVQAIEAARKLHVKNEWTKKIGESLARYRPREYPVLKEAKARVLADDLSPGPLADTLDGPSRRRLPAEAVPDVAAPPAPAEAAVTAPATEPAAYEAPAVATESATTTTTTTATTPAPATGTATATAGSTTSVPEPSPTPDHGEAAPAATTGTPERNP